LELDVHIHALGAVIRPSWVESRLVPSSRLNAVGEEENHTTSGNRTLIPRSSSYRPNWPVSRACEVQLAVVTVTCVLCIGHRERLVICFRSDLLVYR